VEPDTTVFRVEGSRSLQVFSAYLGIDTTTGSCPAAMSARVRISSRQSPSGVDGGEYCRPAGRGTPLVAERAVRRDERASTELETAAAGAERTGVYGVVPDRVEELSHRRLRGRVVPGDRQGATVGRARSAATEQVSCRTSQVRAVWSGPGVSAPTPTARTIAESPMGPDPGVPGWRSA
jgi:hypothetical protein